MNSASFDLNVVRGAMRRARDCRKLSQREGEQMIVEHEFEKRNLKLSVRAIRREAGYYMSNIQEVLPEQMVLASEPKDVMFPSEDGSEVDISWRGMQ